MYGLGFMVLDEGLGSLGSGFKMYGLGFMVLDEGLGSLGP